MTDQELKERLGRIRDSVQETIDDLNVREQEIKGIEYENLATPLDVFLAHRARGSRSKEPSWLGIVRSPEDGIEVGG